MIVPKSFFPLLIPILFSHFFNKPSLRDLADEDGTEKEGEWLSRIEVLFYGKEQGTISCIDRRPLGES